MSAITAAMVKELRERTGVGMMDCKKALTNANGDMDAAIDALRKAGQAKAVKKEGRTTAEGLVTALLSSDRKAAVLVEVNCETDFVARENKFKEFVASVAETALGKKTEDVSGLLEEQRLALVSQLGENINIRRVKLFITEQGIIGCYNHGGESLSRISSVVVLSADKADLAKDLAMHIAAMNPEYISEKDIPSDRVTKEQEILIAQAREANPNKPEDILQKIISGKLAKFTKEITLVNQAFVKDPEVKISDLLKKNQVEVLSSQRFAVGEGIEKQEDNFVAEVMSQVKGS